MKSIPLRFAGIAIMIVCSNVQASVQSQLQELVTAVKGKRIGLITNPSGCDESGAADLDFLLRTPGTTITAFFAPEHGIRGALPAGVGGGDYVDPATSIPVYAVYGLRKYPTNEQLANVDVLVFDMQDVGVRFYTFVWTMTYCMDAAAANSKPFYIIDRPNPIDGVTVDGSPNTVEAGLVGRLIGGTSMGVATRHGMTAGEIGNMWNETSMSPKVELHVIKCTGWSRKQTWSEINRVFVPPSPNMKTTDTATVYPGTCVFEGSNFSIGRGTSHPFEQFGAPFVDGAALADRLTSLSLPGVKFTPTTFTPSSSRHSGHVCNGVRVAVTDRNVYEPVRAGMHMLKEAYMLHPTQFTMTSYAGTLMGITDLQNRIKTETVESLVAEWQTRLSQFKALRAKYLLYP